MYHAHHETKVSGTVRSVACRSRFSIKDAVTFAGFAAVLALAIFFGMGVLSVYHDEHHEVAMEQQVATALSDVPTPTGNLTALDSAR